MRLAKTSVVRTVVLSLIAVSTGSACTIEVVMKTPDLGGGGASGGASGAPGPSGMSPSGPLAECLPTETTGLAACCDPYGAGHCLPDAQVPPDLFGHTDACAGGGACVPDERIVLGGAYEPVSCSSIGGAPGACLSLCMPDLAANAGYLPQDICPPHQRCAPCVHPLSGEPTGACIALPAPECGGSVTDGPADSGSTSSPPPPPPPPPPLPECCEGRARCVLASGIPSEHQSRLGRDTCDADRLCLPTELIDPAFVPRSCTISWMELFSAGSGRGACLSDCIPEVASQAILGQEDCPAHYKCAPCNDPLTGDPTGACGAPTM